MSAGPTDRGTGTAPVARRAARVLCLDPDGALLLVGGTDPARPHAPAVWLPPGGGVTVGESAEAAARRELFEETGLWLDDVGPAVTGRTVEFDFAGRRFRQRETWFAVRVARFEPRPTAWTRWERRSLVGTTWWRPGDPPPGPVPGDVVRLGLGAHRDLPAAVVRPTVRVLVVDDADRCLLMATAGEDGRRVWFPPGGGLEPGEDPVTAARRELAEELGTDVLDPGPCVWTRRHVVDGTDLRERWHLHRVDRLEPDTSGWTVQERATVQALRWWTMAEMTATSDLLVPRDLAAALPGLLADAAAGRLPATPRRVGL